MNIDKEVQRIMDSELFLAASKKATELYPEYNNSDSFDSQQATEFIVEKVKDLYPEEMSDQEFASFYEALFCATMDSIV